MLIIGSVTLSLCVSLNHYNIRCDGNTDPRQVINTAKSYGKLNDFENALKILETLTDEQIFEYNTELLIAVCMMEQINDSNRVSTIKYYRQYLENPKSDKNKFDGIYVALGLLYGDEEQYEIALKYFGLLSEENIIKYNVEHRIANCHFWLRQYDDAVSYYFKYTENPKSDETLIPSVYGRIHKICFELQDKYEEVTINLNG